VGGEWSGPLHGADRLDAAPYERTDQRGNLERVDGPAGARMQAAAEDMQRIMSDPVASAEMANRALAEVGGDPDAPPELTRFLGELKSFVGTPAAQPGRGGRTGAQWQPLKVTSAPVVRERRGPANSFEVTFPQGVLWGLIGCVMMFGISLVTERTHGTLIRLRMAPLTRAQILGGKTWTMPVLANGLIYCRNSRGDVAAVDLRKK